jgi:hypothetical protein
MPVQRIILISVAFGVVGAGCVAREPAVEHSDFSGIYRPAGLEVQPCGRNEWMRRSFETDTFCNGDSSAFPFTAAGMERWKSYNVIDDPVLGCVEDFPRNAMRGRPMRVTLGDETTEIAYWFNNEWFVRTVHMNGPPPPADTPNTVTGYSTGRWSGDTLIVETTHTRGGPMYNDHKPNSAAAKFTERYWRAPDGQNLIMEMAIDDPETYTKPFVLNRQDWLAAGPDYKLSEDKCEPSSIWERRMRAKAGQQ